MILNTEFEMLFECILYLKRKKTGWLGKNVCISVCEAFFPSLCKQDEGKLGG